MKSKIEIIEGWRTNYLELKFLNGDIILPTDRFGAYALCPGCGSGKTTIVKELMRMKWYEGILYAAFTKSELDLMYDWIKDNINKFEKSSMDGSRISIDDIVVLHSDYSKEGTDKKVR